ARLYERIEEQQPKGTASAKNAETADETLPSALTDAQRSDVIRTMEPAVRKDYLAFKYAESKKEKPLEDQEAYNYLREHGVPQDVGDVGELADYEPPGAFSTFTRRLSEARKALGESKYTRRKGRPHGKSIVRQDEIDQPEDDD